MKLRIKGNTLRLRLTQSEATQLNESSEVISKTSFPDGNVLTYQLVKSNSEKLSCTFANNCLQIAVPAHMVIPWAKLNEVGFSAEIDIEDGENLSILVEKDFKCMTDRVGEDESDLFPNPNKSHHSD